MTDGADAFRVLVVFFDWFAPPCSDRKTAFLPVHACTLNNVACISDISYTLHRHMLRKLKVRGPLG